jgi:hypothetical protein
VLFLRFPKPCAAELIGDEYPARDGNSVPLACIYGNYGKPPDRISISQRTLTSGRRDALPS